MYPTTNEVKLAYAEGSLSLYNKVLDNEVRKLYGMGENTCKIPIEWKCLCLFLYAINTWDCNNENNNFFNKTMFLCLLNQVENLKRLGK